MDLYIRATLAFRGSKERFEVDVWGTNVCMELCASTGRDDRKCHWTIASWSSTKGNRSVDMADRARWSIMDRKHTSLLVVWSVAFNNTKHGTAGKIGR